MILETINSNSGIYMLQYVFLKFVFWQHWPDGCAGCTYLGCFWQTTLVRNLGSNFFSGPRYVVNSYSLLSDKLKPNIQYVKASSCSMTKCDAMKECIELDSSRAGSSSCFSSLSRARAFHSRSSRTQASKILKSSRSELKCRPWIEPKLNSD